MIRRLPKHSSTHFSIRTFLFLFLLGSAFTLQAQTPLRKYTISTSGCTALLPTTPSIEQGLYIDSSIWYNVKAPLQRGEESFTFGVVVLQLVGDSVHLADDDALNNFLDYYKSTLQVVETAGARKQTKVLGKGATGALHDTWYDNTGNQYLLQAWALGNRLAVAYIHGPKAYPNLTDQKAFFAGFKFPEY